MGLNPSKISPPNPLNAIHDSILGAMRNREDLSQMFICEKDLHHAWEDFDISIIFPPSKYSLEETKRIRKQYLRVLSTLVLIGWTSEDLVIKFRSQFLRAMGRADRDLPLTTHDLTFLDNFKFTFRQYQYAFVPAVIEQGDAGYIQDIKDRRLPFSRKPGLVGDGAFGSVSKVEIAPRCLRYTIENKENPEPMIVACKTYVNENRPQEFHKEVHNLQILREAFRGSNRVITHIAAIAHGNDFMILLPLAELYDLETFLRYGYRPLTDTRDQVKVYDFDKEFPRLTKDIILHSALLRELFEISSALVWLHNELRIYEHLDYYLAHMDLKPENILINRDSEHSAGVWMLSDFGVSLFDRVTNEKVSNYHSIRDVGRKLTSKANKDQISRGYGPYEPPEVDLGRVDGRRCDVWSFGCILCDVLAFACGRVKGLHAFRFSRYDGRDDYFYRKVESIGEHSSSIASLDKELKPKISDWFRDLAEVSPHLWIPQYVTILERALIANPADRSTTMSEVTLLLGELSQQMLPGSSEPLHSTQSPKSLRSSESSQMSGQCQRLAGSDQPSGYNRSKLPAVASPKNSMPEGLLPLMTVRNASDERLHHPGESVSATTLPDQAVADASQDQTGTIPEIPSDSDQRDDAQIPSVPPTIFDSTIRTSPKFEYRALPGAFKPIKRKTGMTSVALSPRGDQVAFLSGHQVQSYWTENGLEVAALELPRHIGWTRIRLNPPFLAAYGLMAYEKTITIRNFLDSAYVQHLPGKYRNEEASDILLSSSGLAACIYRRHVQFVSLLNKQSQFKSVEEGLVITKACFTRDGRRFTLWALGASTDHAYFYEVGAWPILDPGESRYQRALSSSKNFELWPFESLPACVVHDVDRREIFVIQPTDQPQTEHLVRHVSINQSLLVASVTPDEVLICIEDSGFLGRKKQMREYSLLQQQVKRANCQSNCVDRRVSGTSQCATNFANNRLLITICTANGETSQYTPS